MRIGERKTGKYYFEGLSTSSFKHIPSKNFSTLAEAVAEAKRRQKAGKIHQAEFFYTKNILSDINVANLDTLKKVRRNLI